MKHNPFVDMKRAMWEQYPEFKTRQDLSKVPVIDLDGLDPGAKDLDQALRYVVLTVSKRNNPLARERDFKYKRDTAVSLIGIRQGTFVYEAIQVNHIWIARMQSVYLRMTENAKYTTWVALLTSYSRDLEFLMMDDKDFPIDPDKVVAAKTKIRNDLTDRLKQLDEMEAALFSDEDTAQGLRSVEMQELDQTGYFAEYYAKSKFP